MFHLSPVRHNVVAKDAQAHQPLLRRRYHAMRRRRWPAELGVCRLLGLFSDQYYSYSCCACLLLRMVARHQPRVECFSVVLATAIDKHQSFRLMQQRNNHARSSLNHWR